VCLAKVFLDVWRAADLRRAFLMWTAPLFHIQSLSHARRRFSYVDCAAFSAVNNCRMRGGAFTHFDSAGKEKRYEVLLHNKSAAAHAKGMNAE